jgi:excisionase family DNA binding protein
MQDDALQRDLCSSRIENEEKMEKICIVKLRKKMGHATEPGISFRSDAWEESTANQSPVLVLEQSRMQEMHDKRGRPESNGVATGRTVALTLNQQQMNALGANPHLMSLLNNEFTGGLETIKQQGDPLVIKFQFAAMIPLRLLKSREVMQMLRISKNYLSKVVREGKLKSYKIGKLRRFLLDDILSYLHDNCEFADLPPNSEAKTLRSGVLERSIQEV